MAVRTVSNRGGNVIGKFPSLKMERMVQFESLVELDYLHLLDYEQDVEKFEEQPLTIEYLYGGKILHYTPDFHVVRSGRNWLIECKADKFVDTDENQRKFAAATVWCHERGWNFAVATADQIRAGYRLQNVKFLTRYARQKVDPAVRSSIFAAILEANSPFSVADLAKQTHSQDISISLAAIFHMLFRHELESDLDQALISLITPIFPPKGKGEKR